MRYKLGLRMLALGTTALIGMGTLTPAQAVPQAPRVSPQTLSTSKLGSVTSAQMAQFQARIQVATAARLYRARSVMYAKSKIGARYRHGASGPRIFDCSGLTSYVWKRSAGKSLPHSSRTQYRKTKRIPAAHRQPGDLVFFFRGGVSHVGIYVGSNKMVSAVGRSKGVRMETIGRWHKRHISGYGRVM